ncbi:TetR/AcrR family transcriptional regulator [uncultured Clostridium sp.]|uniref:TetR/AcrR family transcriptional regulator n=1 Tax=uncultured Clostridium sp. TaxID=59620 RepID=UPI0025DFF387|nr:TetR/AcrR family transcriptional regulator [uncultured Clostridium sp.]
MKSEEKILEAALEVVRDYTISGTRMHLIAEKAGMVQSNLHYYFKTKGELMSALQKKVLYKCLELRESLDNNQNDTLEAKLDVFIEQKKAFIMKYREYDYAELDFWVQGRINKDSKEGFAKSFEGWREEIRQMLEEYAQELSEKTKECFPYQIVSYLEGATIQYLIDEGRFDLDEYFEFGKKMIIKMIEDEIQNNKKED